MEPKQQKRKATVCVNETMLHLQLKIKHADSSFFRNSKNECKWNISIQGNEFDTTVQDLKERLEKMDKDNPAAYEQRWRLHVPGSVSGKHHFLQVVLKDNDRLNEIPLLMNMANDIERRYCNITLDRFRPGNSIDDPHCRPDPRGIRSDDDDDDDCDIDIFKEFRNSDLEYTEMEKHVLNTWLHRCKQNHDYWRDAKMAEVDEDAADTKPEASKRVRKNK
jgi:hypothetical protein